MKNSGPRYYQQFDGGADQDDTHHENVMVHVVPESKCKLLSYFIILVLCYIIVFSSQLNGIT